MANGWETAGGPSRTWEISKGRPHLRDESLTVRVSNLYDKEVFSSSGNHLGRIENVMIEAREGRVSGILLKGKTGIAYENVMAVGDVIIVKAAKD